MADFPENETKMEENEFENSTIFSAPSEHKQVNTKKRSLWTKILASVLSVAILAGGTVAVIKLIPVLENDSSSPFAKEITVQSLKADDFASIDITNANGTEKLYSETKKIEGSTTEATQWYVNSVGKELTSSAKVSEIPKALAVITASREITKKTAKECGLETPSVKAVVTPKSGEAFTVLLGSESPDKGGYYLSLSGSDKIYLVNKDIKSTLDFNILDFADTSSIPPFTNTGGLESYFNNDQLQGFDKIIIRGKNFTEPLEIIQNDDEEISQYLGYIVISPTNRIAENVDPIMALFQNGIEVVGAYSYDVSAASLKKARLDVPDLELQMNVKDKTLTYKFALQPDGSYAAIYNDSKMIHKISGDSISSFVGYTTSDYYSTWICYNAISDLSNFAIKSDDKEYSFGIVKNEKKDESESKDQEDYTITYNGEKLTALNFQYLYQYCITLRCNDFTVEKLSAKPSVSFVFTFKDGKDSIIEFTKVNATQYQYSVDGIQMGRVSVNSINKVLSNAEKVANKETISQIV